MKLNEKWGWFLGFTAVFAALAGFVFWGTWSTDFAPVMPDDTGLVPQTYCEVVSTWWRNFLSGGRIQPTDVLWSGLLVSPYFCKELKFAVALYLAALGLAWFLRGRGLSRLSGYGAGLLLAFCGYWCTLISLIHQCLHGFIMMYVVVSMDFLQELFLRQRTDILIKTNLEQ